MNWGHISMQTHACARVRSYVIIHPRHTHMWGWNLSATNDILSSHTFGNTTTYSENDYEKVPPRYVLQFTWLYICTYTWSLSASSGRRPLLYKGLSHRPPVSLVKSSLYPPQTHYLIQFIQLSPSKLEKDLRYACWCALTIRKKKQ